MTETHIIFTHGGGRLANQLMSHAHLLAFCAQHPGQFTLCNTAIWPWRTQFAHDPVFPDSARPPLAARLCEYLLKAGGGKGLRYLLPAVYRFSCLMSGVNRVGTADVVGPFDLPMDKLPAIDLSDPGMRALLGRRRTLLLSGWHIRSWTLVKAHRKTLLERMLPEKSVTDSARRLVQKARVTGNFLVGVHIRRSDYRTYKDGRFFYELHHYKEWMRQVQVRYKEKGGISFLVCSDEDLPSGCFGDMNVTIAQSFDVATPLRDNTALSYCDLIMAVPSTFALWAAFMGSVPMLILTDASVDLTDAPLIQDSFFDWLDHPMATELPI